MKLNLSFLFLFVLILYACNPIANGSALNPEPAAIVGTDFGVISRDHMEVLSEDIGSRVAGHDEEQEAAQYIAETFEEIGYSPDVQYFTGTDEYDDTIDSANVVAVEPGDSSLEILVGAHYDSAEDGLGTDDNASGVAVMLEVAERIQELPTPYTIRFVAFGAEESDLLGSEFYMAQMSKTDIDNTIAMINMDSLVAGNITYIYSDEGEKAFLRDWTLAWSESNGLDLQTIWDVDLTDPDYGGGSSDYAAFQEAGIPFVYFEATDWTLGERDGYTQVDLQYGDEGEIRHTEYDTLRYLDTTFPSRVNERLKLYVTILYNILTQFEK